MCSPFFRTLFVAAVGVFVCFGAASAQIDYRVNRGDALGTGQALDRNLGLGTGGINPSAAPFDFGQRANAVVSGNVTGLAGFHAFSPVAQNNQFRAALPSADLSSFQARSTNLQDAQQNRAIAPTFYLGRQQTIADLGYIRSGLNAPGSSMLASPYTTPVRPGQLPVPRGTLGIQPGAESELGAFPPTRPLGIRQESVAPTPWRDPLSAAAAPFADAAQSSIFGIPPATRRTGRQYGDSRNWSPADRETPLPWETALEDQSPAQPDEQPELQQRQGIHHQSVSPAQSPFGKPRSGGGRESAVGQTPTSPGSPASPEASAGRKTPTRFGLREFATEPGGFVRNTPVVETAAAPNGTQSQENLEGDAFASLRRSVAAAQRIGVRDFAFEFTPAKTPTEAESGEKLNESTSPAPALPPPNANQLRRRSDARVADLAAAARWASERLEHPLTTFVGTQKSKFNEVMAAAESSLKSSAYYSAADQYSLAHTLDPDNPLPLLGRGHALTAAGDLRSASLMLEQGIARFPQIAAFRLDLVALVGNRDVFDVRRAELERQLAGNDSYDLRFLLGYLELYSGLEEEGVRDLEQAAKLAPPDSTIAMFPDLLLGRRALPLIEDHSPSASGTARSPAHPDRPPPSARSSPADPAAASPQP